MGLIVPSKITTNCLSVTCATFDPKQIFSLAWEIVEIKVKVYIAQYFYLYNTNFSACGKVKVYSTEGKTCWKHGFPRGIHWLVFPNFRKTDTL